MLLTNLDVKTRYMKLLSLVYLKAFLGAIPNYYFFIICLVYSYHPCLTLLIVG